MLITSYGPWETKRIAASEELEILDTQIIVDTTNLMRIEIDVEKNARNREVLRYETQTQP